MNKIANSELSSIMHVETNYINSLVCVSKFLYCTRNIVSISNNSVIDLYISCIFVMSHIVNIKSNFSSCCTYFCLLCVHLSCERVNFRQAHRVSCVLALHPLSEKCAVP